MYFYVFPFYYLWQNFSIFKDQHIVFSLECDVASFVAEASTKKLQIHLFEIGRISICAT